MVEGALGPAPSAGISSASTASLSHASATARRAAASSSFVVLLAILRAGVSVFPVHLSFAHWASIGPRDHFWRSTMAPRSSWPTMWNEFLPISMSMTATAVWAVWDMACFLSWAPLASFSCWGRTIPISGHQSRRTGDELEEAVKRVYAAPCRVVDRLMALNRSQQARAYTHQADG